MSNAVGWYANTGDWCSKSTRSCSFRYNRRLCRVSTNPLALTSSALSQYFSIMFNFAELNQSGRPAIIAHRGASRVRRENTLEAFEAAIAIGADAIEFDVRRTSDGVLIVHHNSRLSPLNHAIAEYNYAALKDKALEIGYHLPRLEEVLRQCVGRISLDIELKRQGYEIETTALVKRYYNSDNAVFKSFSSSVVARLKASAPEFRSGLLIRPLRVGSIMQKLRKCGADFVSPHRKLVRPAFVRSMEAAAMPVLVWTVDDVAVALRLANLKVAAIITNQPDRIAQALRESSSAPHAQRRQPL